MPSVCTYSNCVSWTAGAALQPEHNAHRCPAKMVYVLCYFSLMVGKRVHHMNFMKLYSEKKEANCLKLNNCDTITLVNKRHVILFNISINPVIPVLWWYCLLMHVIYIVKEWYFRNNVYWFQIWHGNNNDKISYITHQNL